VNVDILRSALRRPAAAEFDMGRAVSHSLDNTRLISPSTRRYRFVVFARCRHEVMTK
jgi:hypothetical protein